VADDVKADLIVVGSKGMSSSMRFITGSVPNDLSHHVQRDLLIVQTG
jgi:nucleotide-binding universal stress UspA family protein